MKHPFKRFDWVLWSAVLGVFLPAAGLLHAEATKDAPKVQSTAWHKGLYESGGPSGKSGFVNEVELLNRYKKSEPVREALRAEVRRERQVRRDILKEMDKIMKSGDAEAQAAKQKELKLYDRKTMAYLDQKQVDLFAPVMLDIENAVKKYGAQHQYAIIYPEPHPEAEDLTQKILEQLNQ